MVNCTKGFRTFRSGNCFWIMMNWLIPCYSPISFRRGREQHHPDAVLRRFPYCPLISRYDDRASLHARLCLKLNSSLVLTDRVGRFLGPENRQVKKMSRVQGTYRARKNAWTYWKSEVSIKPWEVRKLTVLSCYERGKSTNLETQKSVGTLWER